MTDELAFAGVGRLLELLRAGEVTSRQLVDLYLDRIARLDGRLNAFTVVLADSARAAADEADRRRAAGSEQPLLGLPIAVKDNLDVVGVPTRYGTGSPELPAAFDSELVSRLRSAGCVLLGKTTMPELALFPFGPARNPWDPTRTSGGSVQRIRGRGRRRARTRARPPATAVVRSASRRRCAGSSGSSRPRPRAPRAGPGALVRAVVVRLPDPLGRRHRPARRRGHPRRRCAQRGSHHRESARAAADRPDPARRRGTQDRPAGPRGLRSPGRHRRQARRPRPRRRPPRRPEDRVPAERLRPALPARRPRRRGPARATPRAGRPHSARHPARRLDQRSPGRRSPAPGRGPSHPARRAPLGPPCTCPSAPTVPVPAAPATDYERLAPLPTVLASTDQVGYTTPWNVVGPRSRSPWASPGAGCRWRSSSSGHPAPRPDCSRWPPSSRPRATSSPGWPTGDHLNAR